MCACTCRRSSVIIFCADFDRSCVRVNEVNPCRTVAQSTARTMGVRSCTCRLRMTLSTKYLVEAGSTNPATRFTAISTKPTASSPRRGLISAQTSGRFFHAFLRFCFFSSFSVLIWMRRVFLRPWMPIESQKLYAKCLANRLGEKCLAFNDQERELALIRGGSTARQMRGGRAFNVQHAGNKFAE